MKMAIANGIDFYGSQATCEKFEKANSYFEESRQDRNDLGETPFEQFEAKTWFFQKGLELMDLA